MKIKNKKSLVLAIVLLAIVMVLSAYKGEASSVGHNSNDSSSDSSFIKQNKGKLDRKFSKNENMTVNVYKKVMKNYTDEEIDNFFAVRQVNDNTRIVADKGGGFFTSMDGKEGVTSVLSTPEGDVVMDLSNHNQSATVGEIKKALKENK